MELTSDSEMSIILPFIYNHHRNPAMLSYNDLEKGTIFLYEGQPHVVLHAEFLRMQQRKPVKKTELKSLITGKIIQRNFQMSESFQEVEIDKKQIKYLYNHRGEYWFCDAKDPKIRFSISADIVGKQADFVKQNTEVTAIKWGEKIITVEFPIKAELKVKEAPPAEKGNSASNTTKAAILETGATIQVPMFVNTGDIIRVNTDTGMYTERVSKASGGI